MVLVAVGDAKLLVTVMVGNGTVEITVPPAPGVLSIDAAGGVTDGWWVGKGVGPMLRVTRTVPVNKTRQQQHTAHTAKIAAMIATMGMLR